jgi:hypothetical protein
MDVSKQIDWRSKDKAMLTMETVKSLKRSRCIISSTFMKLFMQAPYRMCIHWLRNRIMRCGEAFKGNNFTTFYKYSCLKHFINIRVSSKKPVAFIGADNCWPVSITVCLGKESMQRIYLLCGEKHSVLITANGTWEKQYTDNSDPLTSTPELLRQNPQTAHGRNTVYW